jgi:RNA ligase
MVAPPTYPRIPHLVPGRGTRDDLVLNDWERDSFLAREILVEEKLDGANVVIWNENGIARCALRSGPGGMDRAGQLGPLKAWIGEHIESVASALRTCSALYGEWLFLAHSVPYDRLASYLVVLDVWDESQGFRSANERNAVCAEADLVVPPELWRGVAATVEAVESRIGVSRCADKPMEGVVTRALDSTEPRLAKLLSSAFVPVSDSDWQKGRPRNRTANNEAKRAGIVSIIEAADDAGLDY